MLDTASIETAPGDKLLAVSGVLEGNEPISPEGYVAYKQDELSVFPCDPNDDEDCFYVPGRGSALWVEVTQAVPDLTLTIPGGSVTIRSASQVMFGGILSETVETGSFEHIAFTVEYEGQILSDGALRTQGLRNGDPVSVVGRKAGGGGVVPSHLIGGDREQLLGYFRAEARYQAFLRVAGVVMMIFSPFLAVIIWNEFD